MLTNSQRSETQARDMNGQGEIKFSSGTAELNLLRQLEAPRIPRPSRAIPMRRDEHPEHR